MRRCQVSWLSPTRVATPDAATPEGTVARFTFEVAGTTLGEHTQTFGLVHEGVTWFADAGFGPSDDFFSLTVRVVEPPPPPPDDGGGDDDDDNGDNGDVEQQAGAERAPLRPSVEAADCTQAPVAPAALVALLALLRSRRRP